jgi:hypothetical protein
MARRTIICERDAVGDRLRREAIETRPAFSTAIHERIQEVIEKSRQETASGALAGSSDVVPSPRRHSRGRPRKVFDHRAWGLASVSQRVRRVMVASVGVGLLAVAAGVAWHFPRPSSLADPTPSNAAQLVIRSESNATVVASVETDGITPRAEGRLAERQAAFAGSGAVTDRPDLNSPTVSQEPRFGLLVYNDARRAARVLLDRLPVDLRAMDD